MKTRENTLSIKSNQVMNRTREQKGLTILLLASLLMIFLMPFNAMASRERFVLNFNDSQIQSYQGRPATLFLRQSLKQQYPKAEISNMDLLKVVVVAKSHIGKGNAQLRVGNRVTPTKIVEGHPWTFYDERRYSFDRVNFVNPAYNSYGPWQVNLTGNFVVRKVVVEVEDHSWSRHHMGFNDRR